MIQIRSLRLRSLRRTFVAAACFGSAILAPSISSAAPIALPLGSLVSVRKNVACGQKSAGETWLPGTITQAGKFVARTADLQTLQKALKRTKKGTAAYKSLQKQIKSLKKQITKQSTTCTKFGAGVVPPTGTQAAASGFQTIGWEDKLTASPLTFVTPENKRIGEQFRFFCPASGATASVWGTDTYTADSSICNAAVHAGVIKLQFGGNVTLVVKSGLTRYEGGMRNGVTTSYYGQYDPAFSFINPTTGAEVGSSAPVIIPWNTKLSDRGQSTSLEQVFTYLCPANGTPSSVWGSGTYTSDSSICTAAVHAGKITTLRGGIVRVQSKPGVTSYDSTTRNGITTQSYGSWSGSIVFP